MKKLRHPLILLALTAVLVRLALFIFLLSANDPNVFLQGDSQGYLALAHNLTLGHGFSQSTTTPYLPDSQRVPLYSSLIAFSFVLTNSFIPVIVLQVLLSAVLVILTYRIAGYVTERENIKLLTAGLMALEPFSVYISLVLLTDYLFAVAFFGGVLATLAYAKEKQLRMLALASFLFGVCVLMRPIAEFLPLVLIGLAVCLDRKRLAKALIAAIIPCLIVIGPWIIRNYVDFHVWGLSSGGFQNVYSDLGAAVIAVRDHRPTDEVKKELDAEFRAAHPGVDQQRDLYASNEVFREGLAIVLGNPIPTAKLFATISFTFFTHDLWTYYPQKWGWLPWYDRTFSPSLYLLSHGPVETARAILVNTGPTIVLPVAGRLFWLITDVLAFVGFILLLRDRRTRLTAVLFIVFTLYYYGLSLSAGAGMTGRYRLPVEPFLYAAAVIGGAALVTRIRPKAPVL